MTLNVSVVSKHLLAQSSDMRLTDPRTGATVLDASPKQVPVRYFGWQGVIGYSGPAELDGKPTHVWLTELIAGLPQDREPTLQEVVELIRANGSRALAKVTYRRFSLVALAYQDGSPHLYLISNYQRLNSSDLIAPASALFVSHYSSSAMRVFVAGVGSAVHRSERKALLRLIATSPTNQAVIAAMAGLNARAAKRGGGLISSEGMVYVLRPDGTSASLTVGEVKQEFIPRGVDFGQDFGKMVLDLVQSGAIPGPAIATRLVELMTATGSWHLGSPLLIPRMDQTTTILETGELLVVGGRSGQVIHAQAEIYDPRSGGWSSAGTLTTRKHGHEAVRLVDGRVLVTGGRGDDARSCELFDPHSQTWTMTAPMTDERYYHRTTLLANGHVLVTGGMNDARQLASAEVFDPRSESWSVVADMSQCRHSHAAMMVRSGAVLVAGGASQDRGGDFSDCEIFEPATETWSRARSMFVARSRAASVQLLNGRIMVVGARGDRRAEIYDPTLEIWTPTSEMSIERHSGLAATLMPDGSVLVTGGQGPGDVFLATTEIYEPASDKWEFSGTASVGRVMHSLVRLDDGRIAAIAGATNFADVPGASIAQVQTASAMFKPRPDNSSKH